MVTKRTRKRTRKRAQNAVARGRSMRRLRLGRRVRRRSTCEPRRVSRAARCLVWLCGDGGTGSASEVCGRCVAEKDGGMREGRRL